MDTSCRVNTKHTSDSLRLILHTFLPIFIIIIIIRYYLFID